MVTATSAVASGHDVLDTVHLRVIVPVPVAWVNVAFGSLALGANVPVAPPVTIDHVPVAPPVGVLPPSPAVVPSAQIVCGPPALAVGCWLTVTVTSANESLQVELDTVHLNVIVPAPLVGVNVALPVFAFGLNVPVAPTVTIVQVPVAPPVGVLPPRPEVVPSAQIVCGPPALADGCCFTVIATSADAFWPQVEFVTVHLNVIVPAPLVGVKVAFGSLAFGANVPVAPTVTIDHVPVSPAAGVLPPSAAVVPVSQMVCGPPAVAAGAGSSVITTSAVADEHGGLVTLQRRVNG